MNVYSKLLNVQQKLKAPKNQFNSFGKYNYRSCEDILEGLKPCLKEEKAVVIISDEIVFINDRFYVKAIVKFIDSETEQFIESSALAREETEKKGQDAAQVTGSVSSYARKYALNGLFCIDDTKDSDTTNQHGKGDNKPVTPPAKEIVKPFEPLEPPTVEPYPTPIISAAQAKRLFALPNSNTEKVKDIVIKYGYLSSKNILKKDYDNICKEIEQEELT